MSKDYAKYRSSTRKDKPASWRLALPILLGVGLVAVIGFAFLSQHGAVNQARDKLLSLVVKSKSLLGSSNEAAKLAKQVDEPVDRSNEVRFDFYTELPNMQMKPEEEEPQTASVALPKPPADKVRVDVRNEEAGKSLPQPIYTNTNRDELSPSGSVDAYVVQVAIYRDRTQAGQQRLALLLSGIETQVMKVVVDGGEMYRVQQGPFDTAAEARASLQKLQRKGIDAILKKLS